MINIILILLILAVVGGAGAYIYNAKKSGQKCIGCPNSKLCGKSECNCHEKK